MNNKPILNIYTNNAPFALYLIIDNQCIILVINNLY